QVFLSWELVGVCSFLLIGFYYERRSAANAANKAFITNRIGDAGFILGLLILWSYVGTFNFEEIFQRIRSPLRDADGDRLEWAGRIVRAEKVGEDKANRAVHLKVTSSGKERREVGRERGEVEKEGSEVVLFPAAPLMTPKAKGRFFGWKPGDDIFFAK